MKVEDIIAKLAKAGLHAKTLGACVAISVDGGFIKGLYNGPVVFTGEDGKDKTSHKFVVENDGDGFGQVGKDDKKGTELKKGEYLVFGSGLMNFMLKERVGKVTGLVYNGKKPYSFKNAKGKIQTEDSHQFIQMD